MLEVRGMNAWYGDIPVLHDVCLTVAPQEIVVVLGANNAGKSTLVDAISGVGPRTEGTVSWNGVSLSGLSAPAIVGQGVVQVPEGRLLFPNMSVLENLLVGSSHRRSRQNRNENLERVFSLFPQLEDRRRQQAGSLSGGEQQMLSIGRSLMASPQLLILDEPSLGLAPLIVERIIETLAVLRRQGLTVLMIEQNVTAGLGLADRGYVLDQGRVVMSGTAQELRDEGNLSQAYFGS
ncbi:branched-chain amino acid ABC transporter ATP-binding protein [Nocardioides sp. S5]|nr:branched-chain amino acid ABC transporter ATP-binding protein [Nocardioides sp. S5]